MANNTMHRTQVYLTEAEHRALKAMARQTGRSFAATLREAIDTYIASRQGHNLEQAIQGSFGSWRDNETLTNLRQLRQEWDMRESRHS